MSSASNEMMRLRIKYSVCKYAASWTCSAIECGGFAWVMTIAPVPGHDDLATETATRSYRAIWLSTVVYFALGRLAWLATVFLLQIPSLTFLRNVPLGELERARPIRWESKVGDCCGVVLWISWFGLAVAMLVHAQHFKLDPTPGAHALWAYAVYSLVMPFCFCCCGMFSLCCGIGGLLVCLRCCGPRARDLVQRLAEYLTPRPAAVDSQTVEKHAPSYRLLEVPTETQDCVVCVETIKLHDSLRTLPCSHRFHADCIDEWFKVKADCPSCRQPLVPSLVV